MRGKHGDTEYIKMSIILLVSIVSIDTRKKSRRVPDSGFKIRGEIKFILRHDKPRQKEHWGAISLQAAVEQKVPPCLGMSGTREQTKVLAPMVAYFETKRIEREDKDLADKR